MPEEWFWPDAYGDTDRVCRAGAYWPARGSAGKPVNRRLYKSERETQRKLQNSGIRRDARDLHEIAAGDSTVRIVEIHIIENVERLEPELEPHGFAYREVLVEA